MLIASLIYLGRNELKKNPPEKPTITKINSNKKATFKYYILNKCKHIINFEKNSIFLSQFLRLIVFSVIWVCRLILL